MVKFWMEILKNKNRLVKESYSDFLEDKIEVVWLQEIKKILNELGYSYFWNDGKGSNLDTVVDKVKERLQDQGIQQWQAQKETSGSLESL